MRVFYLFTILIALTLFCGCKKDLLQFSHVQKIESLSDTDRLNKVIFTDAQNGYIVGGKWYVEAIILNTKDGGDTWQRQTFFNVGQLLNSAAISTDGTVYCTGFEGKLMHSYDAGKSWRFQQLEHDYMRDIAFTDAGHAIIVGGISFAEGLRYYIDSAGNILKHDTLSYQLNQITMVSHTTGYSCGFGTILKTTDAGQTWSFLDVQGDNFMAMDIHGDEIWVCGNNGSIFHTTNGGTNWERLRNGNDITLPHYKLMGILFKDKLNGWAVGENGLVLYSDDGGKHWMQYQQFTTNMLTSIALCADGRIIVVGENGSIYKLTR